LLDNKGRLGIIVSESKASSGALSENTFLGVAEPRPILGYCYRADHLTVYALGPIPPQLRSAQEEDCLAQEVLLVDELPAGIQ
jgi:hypothetical protein